MQEVEAFWERKRASLAQEQDELATHLNQLLATRKEHTAHLDQKLLSAYETTLQKRGGVAVTVVISGTCLTCGVRVSSSKVSAAQEGALVRCGSCDRIIVIQGG
jgi:predicted  nucleic acid-binding Zn-ribbon protein